MKKKDAGENKLFHNGRIFTANPEKPYAQAMLIKEGKICWIGDNTELPELDPAVKRYDLEGRRVIPGFVDAHMHGVMMAQICKQISCLPPFVHSIAQLQEKIRDLRSRQKEDQWIEAWGYDEGKLSEHRAPTRYDLDSACSDAPVFVMRTCAHSACVNSKALEIAGIGKETPDPAGGEIERDAYGEPTGILRDAAIDLVSRCKPSATQREIVDNLLYLGKLLSSYGITTITDMGVFEKADYYETYLQAVREGFRQQTVIYYMWDYFMGDEEFTIAPERMDHRRQIFVGGLKLIGDGSISGRTAWLEEPYKDSQTDRGLSVCSDELLEDAILQCKRYELPLSVHAMGGRAIDRMIQRFKDEEKWNGNQAPHLRLEHITEPGEEAIRIAAEKGFAFVMQPVFLYSEIESYIRNLGEERLKKTYPISTLLTNGVRVVLSSDAPATAWALPYNPFVGLKGAVTRKAYDGTDCGAQERISIEEALRLYTIEGAKVLGIKDRGMLREGYYADFGVLDRDILSIDSDEIDGVEVIETYISGERVYRA